MGALLLGVNSESLAESASRNRIVIYLPILGAGLRQIRRADILSQLGTRPGASSLV